MDFLSGVGKEASMPVLLVSVAVLCIELILMYFTAYRKNNATGITTDVKTFSTTSGSTNLRSHLVDCHLEDWVDACDDAKPSITISAQVAIKAVEDYRKGRDGTGGAARGRATDEGPQSRPYSKEAFIDALITWITSDDQVFSIVPLSS